MVKNSKFVVICGLITLILGACNPNTETMEARTKNEEGLVKRALEIHDRVLTLDTHADTPLRMLEPGFDLSERHDPYETGSKVDYPRMKEGGLDAIFFAAFVAQDIRDEDGNERAKTLVLQMIDAVVSSAQDNSDDVGLALNPDDAYELEKANKRAIYIGMENGYPIGNNLDNLELFFNAGVRYITLVHSSNNDLSDSATDQNGPEHQGISAFGEKVITEMNRLGIIVDISHGSDDAFYDAIAISKAPIIASHSNARSVFDHKRSMSDEMLKLVTENRGVVNVTPYPSYLREKLENPERDAAISLLLKGAKSPSDMTSSERAAMTQAYNKINQKFPNISATVSDLVDHIDRIAEVAGIDHVGIGSDFDGGGGVKRVFDASEVMNITIELVRRGYSEEEIEKIWSKNLMRVFREVQAVAESMQIETQS